MACATGRDRGIRERWRQKSKVGQIIARAGQVGPGRRRWSVHTLAAAVGGVSPASVQRTWSAHDLKPHLSRACKRSSDMRFEEKFRGVTGLYPVPLEKSLVLCRDEKSRCQTLERTQPGLPLGIGHICIHTRDDYRHDTVTWLAT